MWSMVIVDTYNRLALLVAWIENSRGKGNRVVEIENFV